MNYQAAGLQKTEKFVPAKSNQIRMLEELQGCRMHLCRNDSALCVSTFTPFRRGLSRSHTWAVFLDLLLAYPSANHKFTNMKHPSLSFYCPNPGIVDVVVGLLWMFGKGMEAKWVCGMCLPEDCDFE